MKIKVAVIGTSKITDLFIDAAKQDERFILQGVYSRQLSTAENFANKHHAIEVFDDLALLASSKNIDAVYIASPNSFHADQAIQMMNGGKHVLCEKPIAANQQELSTMMDCAKQNNVCLMEAMLNSFVPNFIKMKEAIPQLGILRKFTASFCHYSSRYNAFLNGENPNTFNLKFANGALMDIGVYPLYVVTSLFGYPDSIQSQSTKLSSGVDGCGDLLLGYSNNSLEMQAVISYSKISSGENVGEIQGEEGRLIWEHSSTFNFVYLILNNGEKINLSVDQNDNRMVYECRHFFNLLEQSQVESPVNSWQLSEQVLTIIDKVRKQQDIVYPNDKCD